MSNLFITWNNIINNNNSIIYISGFTSLICMYLINWYAYTTRHFLGLKKLATNWSRNHGCIFTKSRPVADYSFEFEFVLKMTIVQAHFLWITTLIRFYSFGHIWPDKKITRVSFPVVNMQWCMQCRYIEDIEVLNA